ncbi:DNA topoisomerase 3 [Campylobacter fetus]|uniref:DNA topoisomerase 3 n=1 Tax=Campylobacter fetus TaxID=196 RepID=UPI000818A544|nr:DNA topoisomerase 3 [Campylobacter fetus]KAA3685291.1 DNA topoisomerase III [Campylobacter fetus subsp. fetus]OCS40346.1 DNA topoisomerase III [Campylobacter fetus subsp. venerealis cfvi92/203]
MRLFIAEKPELARAIANGMDGKQEKFDGYIKIGNDIITWAFGHILELCEPNEYDEKYNNWNLADLPFEINDFKYKPKEKSKAQLKAIIKLINDNQITEIVHCGDYDEEGQILIDEIIIYSKTNKPVKRMLLQDITEAGIKKSLKDLRPNSDFQGMSDSGFARSQADWIVGLNLTRAYTIKARQQNAMNIKVLSVGRVQTPILGLIVARDKEHESHQASYYYSITANINTQGLNIPMRYKLSKDEKITDESVANDIKANTQGKNGLITKATHENKKEFAPLPYSLLILQAECSKKFGYKPDKVLEITQSLRENHKAISYNRSDCQYLNENTFQECPSILKAVANNLNLDISKCDTTIKHSAFNDEFVTAHTGIIPLANPNVKNLSKEELNIYTLICKRFVALFYPPMEYISTNLEVSVDEYKFVSSAKKILKAGYKEVYNESDDEESDDEIKQDLSSIKENETALINEVKISKEQTKPKPYYTMATLLKDLTSVSKYVKDEKIKKLLQEKDKGKKGENGGIGTPATRSEHIKNLFERGYIVEKGKNIVSSELGRQLYSVAPEILTSVDLTALWFEEQKEISARIKSKDEFLLGVKQVVRDEINRLKEGNFKMNLSNQEKETYQCPKCQKGFLQKKKSVGKTGKDYFWWGCSEWKNGCDFKCFDDNGKPNFDNKTKEIDQTHKCPQCNKGFLQRMKNKKGNWWWGCSEFKQGCKAMYYDDNGKPKIQ